MPGSRRAHRFILWSFLALFLAASLGSPGCGGSKSGGTPTAPILETIPEAWEGVWSVRTIVKLCNTSEALVDTTIVDTLCGGTTVSEWIDTANLGFCQNTEVRGTASSVSFACNESFNEGGCAGTFSLTLNTTVDAANGSLTGAGRLSVNSTPDTGECQDFCLDITQMGTRLDEDPACPAVVTVLDRTLVSRALERLAARQASRAPAGADRPGSGADGGDGE